MTHVTASVSSRLVARTRPLDVPADSFDLLDRLGRDGFAWFDGDAGFVTSGVAATVAPSDAPAFLRALAHDRDADTPAGAGPRAVGALPFAGDGRLTVPSLITARDADGRGWCTVVGRSDEPSPLRVAAGRPSRFRIEPCTTAEEWREAVAHALALIDAGQLEKVVLARAVRVEADRPFEPRTVLAELRRTQPACTVYAAGGFVGATPELLLRKRGNEVLSRPLAGTGTDVAGLLASRKDAHEHAVVVDAVVRALTPTCGAVRAEGPAPLVLADVTHLATSVSARCTDARASAIDLVRALHPTPAVAGAPRATALDAIRRLEPMGRGSYAGPCGWVDARGDGEFVVALRCGALEGATALLHSGAGIVTGSDPEAEWYETQQKLEPMLRALVRP
jgi:menaquinone-specific isochorismate synthase